MFPDARSASRSFLWGLRAKLVPVVASLTLMGVSCTHSAEGQLPTPEMISDVLPTVTEMPGEWDETQRQVFETREPEYPSIDPSVWCPDSDMVTKNLVELAGDSAADVEMQARIENGAVRMLRLQASANDDMVAYFRDS